MPVFVCVCGRACVLLMRVYTCTCFCTFLFCSIHILRCVLPTDGSGKEALLLPTPIHPSPGNGVIAQPKKIRGVGFGDIFREGSVKLKARLPSTEGEEKKDKVSELSRNSEMSV